MRYAYLLFAYALFLPIGSPQPPESLNEVLPIHHPTDGHKTVLLSYTNRHDKPVVIDSYSAACVCSRDVKIPKSVVEPGESIELELNFLVPNRPQESLQLDFSVSGHVASTDEKEHARELAKYHLDVPVYEPIGLLRKHEFLSVVGGAKCNTSILNASALKWAEVRIRVVEFPELVTKTTLSATRFGKNTYQTVDVEIDGFQKFLTTPNKPESITLLIFAHSENQTSFESVGMVIIPVKWHSEIEHFPKKISVGGGAEPIEVNLVGRGIPIAGYLNELTILLGTDELAVAEYQVTTLSPKWLRVSVASAALLKVQSKKLSIDFPMQGWHLEVDLEFTQPEPLGKGNGSAN